MAASRRVRSKRLLGIALCRSEGGPILFRDSNEKPQCLIYSVGVWKRIGDIRLEANYITKTLPAGTESPNSKRSEIILGTQLVFGF